MAVDEFCAMPVHSHMRGCQGIVPHSGPSGHTPGLQQTHVKADYLDTPPHLGMSFETDLEELSSPEMVPHPDMFANLSPMWQQS